MSLLSAPREAEQGFVALKVRRDRSTEMRAQYLSQQRDGWETTHVLTSRKL